MVDVNRVADLDALTTTAAERFVATVRAIQIDTAGVHGDGIARVVLTGGTAGIQTLAKVKDLGSEIEWDRVHIFFGDERNVPADHPDSNEGQARAVLLDHVNIPAENIHGYNLGAVELQEAARSYAAALERFAPAGFDLHLLGMGGEGHINSLFPHTAEVREESQLVLPVWNSPKPPAERATLTLPAVHRAARVWLLVSGTEKAEAAGHVAAGSPAVEWPAAGAHGSIETILFVSEDAATKIQS